jgi:hypothetical protein
VGRASRAKRERRAGKTTTQEILQNARKSLDIAAFGAALIRKSADLDQRLIGVHNTIVFGRAVLHILENLRRTEPSRFETWYAQYESDSLLSFLIDFRNRILKEGEVQTTVRTHIAELNFALLRQLPRPPGAKHFFIGDRLGGSGWEVELAGGQIEKYYVALPRVPGLIVNSGVTFSDAPEEFSGMPIQAVCDRIIERLSAILAEANKQFLV